MPKCQGDGGGEKGSRCMAKLVLITEHFCSRFFCLSIGKQDLDLL